MIIIRVLVADAPKSFGSAFQIGTRFGDPDEEVIDGIVAVFALRRVSDDGFDYLVAQHFGAACEVQLYQPEVFVLRRVVEQATVSEEPRHLLLAGFVSSVDPA